MTINNPSEAIAIYLRAKHEIDEAENCVFKLIKETNLAYFKAQRAVQAAWNGKVWTPYGGDPIGSSGFDTFEIKSSDEFGFTVELTEKDRDGDTLTWTIKVPFKPEAMTAFVSDFQDTLTASYRAKYDDDQADKLAKRRQEYLKLRREFGDNAV